MAAHAAPSTGDRCDEIAQCSLWVSDAAWVYAEDHREEIAAYWAKASAARPKLFNGNIFVLGAGRLQGAVFGGSFLATDFASFLYWRDQGYPETGVRDGFGSAVIRSAEGYVLYGRQTGGNLNAGLVYPPGGFIDPRDVAAGSIDIDAGIARELTEETGLAPADLERTPGYLLTRAGPLVSIAIEWRSALSAEALRKRILEHVARQAEPELEDVVIIRSRRDVDDTAMPRHACAILGRLLGA
jgi:NUDIX domain-containing protein